MADPQAIFLARRDRLGAMVGRRGIVLVRVVDSLAARPLAGRDPVSRRITNRPLEELRRAPGSPAADRHADGFGGAACPPLHI